MTLRFAAPSDAALLAALHATAFPKPWTVVDMAAFLADRAFVAVVADDRGFILARATPPEAEVLTLAVAPAHRRAGLARALMQAGMEALVARGVTTLWLDVAVDNRAARALYKSLRFRNVSRRKAYYTQGPGPAVDGLVMRRTLP